MTGLSESTVVTHSPVRLTVPLNQPEPSGSPIRGTGARRGHRRVPPVPFVGRDDPAGPHQRPTGSHALLETRLCRHPGRIRHACTQLWISDPATRPSQNR